MSFTLETAFLLSEAAFYHSETSQDLGIVSINPSIIQDDTYDIKLLKRLGVSNTGGPVPNENIHTLCVSGDLVTPLHDRNSWPRW